MDDIYTRNGTEDRKVHAPMYDELDCRVAYKYNGTENFSIHLLSPVNATLNDDVGIVTIVDDD